MRVTKRSFTKLVICFLLLLLLVSSHNVAAPTKETVSTIPNQFKPVEEENIVSLGQSEINILAGGQFVYGTNVDEIDVEKFLPGINSAVLPFTSIIEDKSDYYSINRTELIKILGVNGNLVTSCNIDALIDSPNGYLDVDGFEPQKEAIFAKLYDPFFAKPYQPDELPDQIELTLNSKADQEFL